MRCRALFEPAIAATLLLALLPAPVRADGNAFFLDADRRVRQIADFRGGVAMVALWASWCAPCRRELPALAALHRHFSGRGLEVVAVAVEDVTAARVGKFYAELGIADLPVYVDPDGSLLDHFAAQALPVTVLLGPDGVELSRVSGAVDWAEPQMQLFLADLVEHFRASIR